ncbi:MAG TPA: IS630 family transposase [Bacteroidota bacterium]|nr:IS630 family transposase [Bacteroidota bacterium]
MWCVAELNDEYIERMENILDLYEKPYDSEEPVICIDEKSVQLREDIYRPIPAKPGKVKKVDAEYKRRGTVNIFAAIEPKCGRHGTYVTENRKSKEFAKVVSRIAIAYQDARTIHLVCDNLNTHNRKSLIDFYGIEKGSEIWSRFTVHYTPKHGSWLNQAEIELSMVSNQCLGKNRISDINILRMKVNQWNRDVNKKRVKISWTFTADKAKKTFKY